MQDLHIICYVVLMLTVVCPVLKCPKIRQDRSFIEIWNFPMPEQRKLEKWKIFCKSWKRWSVSCYTDRLLANQISGKPVRISCHLITTVEQKSFFIGISFILDKAHLDLDFEIKIAEICWKLNEIRYFEVEHTKFYKSNFGNFWVGSLPNFCRALQQFM